MTRGTALALLVAGALFMQILDATVITTAIPTMAHDFGNAPSHLSLGVSAYLIALTVMIPTGGWAADRFGARRVFLSALAVFAVSSLFCAVSTNLTEFTLARILQGFGAALMVPVGRIVVLRQTPKSELVRTMAILTWPALAAPLIGPALGGWLTTHWSWHWIFLLNIPLAGLAMVATWWLFPVTRADVCEPFDRRGFLLLGSGFLLFMSGIEAASRRDLGQLLVPMALMAVGLGVALLAWALRYLFHTEKPILNPAALTVRTFRTGVLGGSLFRTAIGGLPFVLPLLLQVQLGMSALEAGAMIVWLFAGNLAMKPATTWLMNQFGFKLLLVTNGIVVAVTLALMSTLSATTSYWLMAGILFGSGMARSLQFTALNALAFADIEPTAVRDASTLQAVIQQMNMGTGVAVGALALMLVSYTGAIWVLAGIALLAVIDWITLPAAAGNQVLKPRAVTAAATS